MSEVVNSPYKNPGCGGMPPTTNRDILGGYVHCLIVGTDPNVGVVSGSGLATKYYPPLTSSNYGLFKICIETDNATYYVSLEDGSDFVITPAQSHRYYGDWYPANLLSVNVGTTGDFSVGY
jgi:hypothetical protein